MSKHVERGRPTAERAPVRDPWTTVASLLALVTPLGLGLIYRWHAGAVEWSSGQGFPLDDAWIHAQFALNASRGALFQYELGTLSSGSTAPLWSLLEGLLLIALDDPVLVGHLLGLLFSIATSVMAVALARRMGLRGFALIAVPLLLACQWRMAWAAVSGMEITLTAFLIELWLWLYLDERRGRRLAWRSGLIAGLLVWVRPEGLLAFPLMLVDQALLLRSSSSPSAQTAEQISSERSRRRHLLALAVGWALIVAPLFILNAIAGPGILPQTVYAKAQTLPLARAWHLLAWYPLEMAPSALLWRCFFVGAVGWAAVHRCLRAWKAPEQLLPVLFVLCFFAGIAYLKGSTDHYSRYIAPLLPLLVILGVEALDQGARALGRWRWSSLAAVIALLMLLAVSDLRRGAETYALNVSSVNEHVVAMGRWLRRHVPADAVLAMSDVGAIAYFTENPIVDMRGLVSSYHGWDRLAELERQRRVGVSYALLFPELNERVILAGRYQPIHALTLDRNNISATDNLVVYRTPWSDGRRLERVGRAFDFESGTLDGWQTEGVFRAGPRSGAGEGQRRVINLGGGRWLLSSWGEGGDGALGRALSPSFELVGDVMTARVGGGERPVEVGLRLWVDGEIRRSAQGASSEVLLRREWDIRELRGQQGRLEVFDDSRRGWGHVMVDSIEQWRVLE